VDFLLNKITTNDRLFGGDYTVDLYQNCEFGCLYCDSSFDKTIYIKTNAKEILQEELEKTKKGKIIVGSVHDPYQKAEEEFKITRDLLKIIQQQGFSCHILTKSDLVIRDIDIISEIDNCLITLSIISLKESISKVFEKNLPSTKTRLQTIEKLTKQGIKAGLAIIPVLPYIVEDELEDIVKSARNHKAEYLLHKHLELKGDQKTFYINILKEPYLDLVEKYEKLYKNSYTPDNKYISKINNNVSKLCNNYGLKNRI
jgi:DNA repair photolyase